MESAELKRRKIVLKKNSPLTNKNDDFLIEINNHENENETTCLNNGDNCTNKKISLDETHLLLEKKLREKLIEAQRNLNEIEQEPKEKCDSLTRSRKEADVSLEQRHNNNHNNVAKLDEKKKGKTFFGALILKHVLFTATI